MNDETSLRVHHRNARAPAAAVAVPARRVGSLALVSAAFGALLAAVVALAAGAPIAPADLDAVLHAPNPPLIVDVRTPEEFRAGHITGALNVQHDTVDSAWSTTGADRDDEVILYCGTGRRAGLAQQTLESMGWYHTRVLTGGIDAWKKAGLPLVTDAPPKAGDAQ